MSIIFIPLNNIFQSSGVSCHAAKNYKHYKDLKINNSKSLVNCSRLNFKDAFVIDFLEINWNWDP